MGDMDDESIHAVFKTFHSFRDGKISSITVQRKKETKMKHEMPALWRKKVYIFRNRKEIND